MAHENFRRTKVTFAQTVSGEHHSPYVSVYHPFENLCVWGGGAGRCFDAGDMAHSLFSQRLGSLGRECVTHAIQTPLHK